MIKPVPFNICAIRRQKRAAQRQFWSRVGVDQSSGSRFETKNGLPPAVDILFRLAYVMTDAEAEAALAALRQPFPLELDTPENHRAEAIGKIIGSMYQAAGLCQ